MYIITSYYGKEVSQPLVINDRNEAYKAWTLDVLKIRRRILVTLVMSQATLEVYSFP